MDPAEVLYELDSPKVFTVLVDGALHLAYESDICFSTKMVRYLVAPSSDSVISELKAGSLTVLDALDQPWVWAVDQSTDGLVTNTTLLDRGMASVPDGFKPRKDVMLWPHLMPLVSVRLIGPQIKRGTVPASVIKRAAEGIPAALKKLFERAYQGANRQGRPEEWRRSLYDLPAQRFAFNSFEISFHEAQPSPQETLPFDAVTNSYLEQGAPLKGVLDWAAGDSNEAPDASLVEAVEKLVPPMHGVVHSVEIKGRLFDGGQPVVLTRESTRRVKGYLANRRADARVLVNIEGIVDELDKGKMSFTLRGTTDATDVVFTITEDFFDDVFDAFEHSLRVSVSGKRGISRQAIDVLGFEIIEPRPPLTAPADAQ